MFHLSTRRVVLEMPDKNQLKIFSLHYKNECYGKLYLSNTEFNKINEETNDFNKEDDIYIDENNRIYIFENTKYYLSFKTEKNFEEKEIFNNIPEEVILKETYNNKNEKTTKNIILSYGNYVGKTNIRICYKNKEIFNLVLEVRSSKMDYEADYKRMIIELSNFNNGLLYSTNSPVYQLFEMSDEQKEHMKYQYYMYLESLFSEDNLPFTYNYLIRNMNSRLESYKQNVPIQFASNIDISNITNYLKSDNLQRNTIYSHLPSYVPLKVDNIKHIKTINTPENQFFKYFLELVNNIIEELFELFEQGYPNERLQIFKSITDGYLSNIKFKEISRLDYLPLNSQVLQKKEGYKEILEYYFKLENTYNTVWEDVNNLIKGHEKKIYDLYERWCYFQLIEIISEITGQKIEYEDVFILNTDSQIYDIQTGFNHKIHFDCPNKFNKPLTIELWYNKQFNGCKNEEKFSSYSINLRPDYTILIEYENSFKLIHFDAKYKKVLFDDEEDVNKNIDHTQADIAKMHAYYDGIRNSVGAYILYPGNNPETYYKYDNNIPTVGSFSLIPNNKSNKRNLKEKLENIIEETIK